MLCFWNLYFRRAVYRFVETALNKFSELGDLRESTTKKTIKSDTEWQIFHKVTSFNSKCLCITQNECGFLERQMTDNKVLLQAVGNGGAWSLEKRLPGHGIGGSMREKDTFPIFATRNFRKTMLKTIMRAVNLTDLLWKVCLVYVLLSAVWLVCVNAGDTAEVLLVQRHLVIIPESQPLSLYPHTLVKVKSIKVQQRDLFSVTKNVDF